MKDQHPSRRTGRQGHRSLAGAYRCWAVTPTTPTVALVAKSTTQTQGQRRLRTRVSIVPYQSDLPCPQALVWKRSVGDLGSAALDSPMAISSPRDWQKRRWPEASGRTRTGSAWGSWSARNQLAGRGGDGEETLYEGRHGTFMAHSSSFRPVRRGGRKSLTSVFSSWRFAGWALGRIFKQGVVGSSPIVSTLGRLPAVSSTWRGPAAASS